LSTQASADADTDTDKSPDETGVGAGGAEHLPHASTDLPGARSFAYMAFHARNPLDVD